MSGNHNDDDSFSSDSDDEFLTLRGDGSGVDREALVRKKLLESFYGKTNDDGDGGRADESSDDDSSSSDDEDDGMTSTDDEDDNINIHRARRRRTRRLQQQHQHHDDDFDLDSPHFDAPKHTERYVLQKSVHPLLETEESLACQVRTLDSSMQTLVYENYSRFIEATEAIRNIGVHVQCNVGNLQHLSESVVKVGTLSKGVEDECGNLRDAVVEKLRTKRLLQRLESLLKLPSTLRENIKSGNYRWATKSYLKAFSILSKQSEGFESLQRIEQECQTISEKLRTMVRQKLLHWSGNAVLDDEDPLDPPQSVVEIFECAGTHVLFLDHSDTVKVPEEQLLSCEDCREMALDSCLRLVERFLDAHHIELQEVLLGDGPSSSSLIPTNVLDAILEASALYSLTFPSDTEPLLKFVATAFSSFLQHVENALLEQSSQHIAQKSSKNNTTNDDEYEGPEADDDEYEHIETATAVLLESVRQFSSGLALAISDEELPASVVEQTLELSNTMVRRRVDQTFVRLRSKVLANCLAPFCQQALLLLSEDEAIAIDRLIQLASVALSDASQLVDDTVRSILSAGSNKTLGVAVETSTARFAVWLAGAMELFAGCESSKPMYVLDITDNNTDCVVDPAIFRYSYDDNDDDNGVEDSMNHLLDEISASSKKANNKLTLAIAEMCRLAERSLVDDIHQSIATHKGGGVGKLKTSHGLFGGHTSKSTTNNNNRTDNNSDDLSSLRFSLAASRVLGLYAMNRGNEAGELLSADLVSVPTEVSGPSESLCTFLALTKETILECVGLLGCPVPNRPVPETLEDEFESLTMARQKQALRSTLAIDVERMFAETVVAYPHPCERFEFDLDVVVAKVVTIAVCALKEETKTVRFGQLTHRQLLVNIEFLRFWLPHYVGEEHVGVLEGLLHESIHTAKERCDGAYEDDTTEINHARALIRDFLEVAAAPIDRFALFNDAEREKTAI